MGHFLDTAYIVLKNEKKPLSAHEITEKALMQNLLTTKGKTPHQSMKARISMDILRKKEQSAFQRTEAGTFALREWSTNEYVAPRHKKGLIEEDIAVFDRAYLKDFVSGRGIFKKDLSYISKKLNEICFSCKRKDAELNNSLIQLVSVFITRYKNKYLTFKRTKRLPESRLHGYYSIGFGGHITFDELLPMFNIFDPNHISNLSDPNYRSIFIIKELSEELKLQYTPKITYRGLIYDDSKEVSIIHLGIMYDVTLDNANYEIGERGFLIDPKFEDIQAICKRKDDFENWSQIIIKEEGGNWWTT
jgi:predicted NUDIX family phosphoesterase